MESSSMICTSVAIMSLKMAKAINREDEAEEYFKEAVMLETTWGYDSQADRYCTKVLEFSIGHRLSIEDLACVEDYAISNDRFYFKCLQAHLNQRRGSVSWNPSSSHSNDDALDDLKREEEEYCNNCGKPSRLLEIDTGKKLLRCTRCKSAILRKRMPGSSLEEWPQE